MVAVRRHHRVGIALRGVLDDLADPGLSKRAHALALELRSEVVARAGTGVRGKLVASDAMALLGLHEEIEGLLAESRDREREREESDPESAHQLIFNAFSAARSFSRRRRISRKRDSALESS